MLDVWEQQSTHRRVEQNDRVLASKLLSKVLINWFRYEELAMEVKKCIIDDENIDKEEDKSAVVTNEKVMDFLP